MDRVLVSGPGYQRLINRNDLLEARPLFKDIGEVIDVSLSNLSPKILNELFDIVEKKPINPPVTLSKDEFLLLIQALEVFGMNSFIRDTLYNFRKYVTTFNRHDFSEIIFTLAEHGLPLNLSHDDLSHVPVYDPFEKYIIDGSKSKDLDYSYFSTTSEARYSSLMPWHLDHVRRAFLSEAPTLQRIVDMTAHIGVDSVYFSILYPRAFVMSIEIDQSIYLRLCDNLIRYTIILNREQYMSQSYEDTMIMMAYNSDSTEYLTHPFIGSADMVYLDPPWGGPEYQKQEGVKLYLGKMEITDVIIKLIENNHRLLVVLKAPINIDRTIIDSLGSRSIRSQEYGIYTKPIGGKLSYLLFFFRIA